MAKNFIFSVILVTVVLVVPLNLAWIPYRQNINLNLRVSDPSMLNNQDYQFTASFFQPTLASNIKFLYGINMKQDLTDAV